MLQCQRFAATLASVRHCSAAAGRVQCCLLTYAQVVFARSTGAVVNFGDCAGGLRTGAPAAVERVLPRGVPLGANLTVFGITLDPKPAARTLLPGAAWQQRLEVMAERHSAGVSRTSLKQPVMKPVIATNAFRTRCALYTC